ncbi:MAG: hypothetical protein ACT4P2_06840 [Pseudomonadota bacterium]
MALNIATFSNVKGGDSFFKAVGHPLAAPPARVLVRRLRALGPVAIYDPVGGAEAFAALHDLAGLDIAGVFVQALEEVGRSVLGRRAQPVTDLAGTRATSVLVTAFDSDRFIDHIRRFVPPGAEVASLDAMRLPESFLSNRRVYLDAKNFATNFAFFRDEGGRHTRLATANYWHGYGAGEVGLWLCLFGAGGETLAEWREPIAHAPAGIVIDSREVRRRFGLPEFTGQLFIHVAGAAGHDVVKYALDVFGDRPEELSCTHDANAWPADFYAGLPAPGPGERVILWIQNSHPCPIPAKGIGLNRMGRSDIAWLDRAIPPFGSYPLDVADLLPATRWPQQIEIQAGKHIVRPRYEIVARSGRRRLAHPNVERTDLRPDARIPELANLMGKGYLLPAPVLPPDRFRTLVLPTPMARTQADLPLGLKVYDAAGREVASRFLGRLARHHAARIDASELGAGLGSGYGHLELNYDFRDGGGADGWLHALFRYEDRRSAHVAETSFGAHIFNTALTYNGEPQSYGGRPPGLSTRLFLRLGHDGLETFCHLIYAASTPWHPHSETSLSLHDGAGAELAATTVRIPCGGSLLWRAGEMFDPAALARAGGGYVLVRDPTCRLFGYHGLLDGEQAFSLDHMFGF